MGRGRSRSRSRSRSRRRSYSPKRRSRSPSRRKRYDEPPRRRHHHQRRRQSPAPCGLLVRNVALDTRPEDLKIPFEKFGPVKDVYLPKNYYTGEPRGFAFVKFRFPEDAAEAKDRLNHRIVGGREIRIVYAEENRKTPQEMRKGARASGSRDRYGGRRTLSRSPRRRHLSHSRSPASGRHQSRSVSRSRSPYSARSYRSTGRSLSPRDHSSDERECKTRGEIRSPKDSSPHNKKGYKSARRSHSSADMSPPNENYKSPGSPALRENSAHDRKHSRLPGRSISPRKESPLTKDCKAKQKEDSSGVDYKSNKISLSSQEIADQDERRGISSQKISSPGKQSSGYETGHRSKQRSISPGENGGSPLHGRNLPSSSPRMKARSLSPSHSLLHSPR